MVEIEKSSRYPKIIDNFGENMICNWLSRPGLEVTLVDHTGIDVLAYNPKTGRRYGITVKSRMREKGKETEDVTVFQEAERDRNKLIDACKAFACEPWIAVYVETSDAADVYLTGLTNYEEKYAGRRGKATYNWDMSGKTRQLYEQDPNVKHIRIEFRPQNWDWDGPK